MMNEKVKQEPDLQFYIQLYIGWIKKNNLNGLNNFLISRKIWWNYLAANVRKRQTIT
jgi:hypothetical protein